LFIGGTGIISTACTQFAIEQGIDLTILTRGHRSVDVPDEVKTLTAKIEDTAELSRAGSAVARERHHVGRSHWAGRFLGLCLPYPRWRETSASTALGEAGGIGGLPT
jgi:hypothetical protein